MLPWPVTIAVKLGVVFNLNFGISSILGKKDFVIAPSEDLSVHFAIAENFVLLIHTTLHYLLF